MRIVFAYEEISFPSARLLQSFCNGTCTLGFEMKHLKAWTKQVQGNKVNEQNWRSQNK